MTAEIICVGTEILLGNIVNTNAAYLAEKCAYLGLKNYFQISVGDNEERLTSCINTARERADVIILSGGLGPTEDDITKEVCAKVFNRKLINDDAAKQNIIDIITKRGLKLTDNNFKQALVPEGAVVLYNDNGTAPGIIIEDGDKTAVLLPGPPNELIPMVENQVVPYFLRKGNTDAIYSRMVKLAGVGESVVAEDLKDLIAMENPTVATYAKTGEVHVRVTAFANDEEEAKKLVKPIVKHIKTMYEGKAYSTSANETLEESVVSLLSKNGLSITTAESCTGGMLSSAIVSVAGASEVFKEGFITYSNKAKRNVLDVKKGTLEKYGAVSEETVKEMARGAMSRSKADVAVAISGIAGPGGGSYDKPIGLVYIACAVGSEIKVNKYQFSGSRNKVRESAVSAALAMIRSCILN